MKNGISKASLLGAPASSYDAAALAAFTSERLERALAILLDLYRNLRYTVDPRFELELAVARLCRLADYVSPSELAAAVASIRHRLAGAAEAADAGRGGSLDVRIRESSDEKKKPESLRERALPPRLNAAFDSLAAAAKQSPADAVPPAGLMNDASEADEEAESTVAEMQETPDSLREAVIAALGRSSPLLKSGLASSLPWRIDETRIVIPFRSGMEESVVRGSIADIAAKASELTGRRLQDRAQGGTEEDAAPRGRFADRRRIVAGSRGDSRESVQGDEAARQAARRAR